MVEVQCPPRALSHQGQLLAHQKDAGGPAVLTELDLESTGETVLLDRGLLQVVDCKGFSGCDAQGICSSCVGLQHGEGPWGGQHCDEVLEVGLLVSRLTGEVLMEKKNALPF